LEDDAEAAIADRDQVGRLGDVRPPVELLAPLDAAEHAPPRLVGEGAEPLEDPVAHPLVVRSRFDASEGVAPADVDPDARGAGEERLAPGAALRPVHQDVVERVVARAPCGGEHLADDATTSGPERVAPEQSLVREPAVHPYRALGLAAEAVVGEEHDVGL